jgi:hypothetical protein
LGFSRATDRTASPKILDIGVTPGYSFELGSRLELHEQVGIGPLAVLQRVRPFVENLDASSPMQLQQVAP